MPKDSCVLVTFTVKELSVQKGKVKGTYSTFQYYNILFQECGCLSPGGAQPGLN